MKHRGTAEWNTARLRLRRFTLSDADAMFKNWASDPEVTKFLTWPAHGSGEISAMILRDWVGNYDKDDYYQWAIEFEGQPIGSISVVSADDKIEKVEIGYCIGKHWWNKGITSEALEAVIKFFFEEVGVNRVEARHDPNNPNSGAVMRKCGMKFEGTLRQADRNNQGICDVSYYSILRCEYFGR